MDADAKSTALDGKACSSTDVQHDVGGCGIGYDVWGMTYDERCVICVEGLQVYQTRDLDYSPY